MLGSEYLAEQLKVYTPENLTKVRLGNESDGGYIVIDEIAAKSDFLLSYGVDTDISFEKAFVERYQSCRQVQLCDPSVDSLPEEHPKMHFTKRALRSDTYADSLEYDLEMAEDGHGYRNITVKMDIEWCEWACFKNFFELGYNGYDLFYVDQLICEFHVIPVEFRRTAESEYFSKFFAETYGNVTDTLLRGYGDVIAAINRTHTLVHVHPNNSLPTVDYGNGVGIPQLLEATFIKSSGTKFRPFDAALPIAGLDFPNKPWKPEITNFYPFKK